MALARYNVRLDPTQVAALEALSRRLSYELNYHISWSSLLRAGAAWVVALEGRPPSEIQNTQNQSPR